MKVGNYIYVKNVGFYPQQADELLKTDVIKKEKISYFLTNYKVVFEENIKNEQINIKPIDAKYYLYFDENENLNIKTYLFDKLDFEKKYSCFFGPWAYVEDKGFYQIESFHFDTLCKVIKKLDVSQFVTDNRIWLHNFEGYKVHFGSIQSHLVFSLTDKDELVFSSKLEFPQELGNFIDFEDWIYIKGIGFFSKQENKAGLPIRPGLIVKKTEIYKFIESNKDELEQIEGFFIQQNPIDKIGLNIFLNEDKKIQVQPEIKVKEGFDFQASSGIRRLYCRNLC